MVSDPVPFLANIVLLAYSDNQLSSGELGQLESIRSELKLKKGELNSAIKLVEEGGHSLILVGTFADQVKNLELMLRVAYSDDDLDQNEIKLIISFCKLIGISQSQLDKIRNEVLANLKQAEKICPKCRTASSPEAKFCNECGISFSEVVNEKDEDFEIPTSGLAIEFAESTATNFDQALKIAKSQQGFKSFRRKKKNWYMAVFSSGNINETLQLVEALSGLRNRNVYIDGKKESWNDVFGFAWCASKRSISYNPKHYCFGKDNKCLNPWGCMQADMDWTGWARWFENGKWEKSGTIKKRNIWRFDKEKISHELEANLHSIRFCPHLSKKLCEVSLKCLPEAVDPEADENWEYSKEYEQVPGAIKIKVTEKDSGYVFSDEFWANGVKPKGYGGLEAILKKSIIASGLKGVSSNELFK